MKFDGSIKILEMKGLLLVLILFLESCSGSPKQDDNSVPVRDLSDPIAQRLKQGILLRGTIVTPNEIIPDGWIFVKDEKIISITTSKPPNQHAIELNTDGVIFPGLIDLHNHVPWNVIPRWRTRTKFLNRYQWNKNLSYKNSVKYVYNILKDKDLLCEMNMYGEIRSLIGGTTSIIGSRNESCIRGFVRNLNSESGLLYNPLVYGNITVIEPSDEDRIKNEVAFDWGQDGPVGPTSCQQGSFSSVQEIRDFLDYPFSKLFLIHLSEGTDLDSEQEFCYLIEQDLLTNKTAIVHGTALNANDFEIMINSNSSLIWSPKSNINLYGKTTDIAEALNAGVSVNKIALSPDWAISGSNNLLDELRYAYKYNQDSLNGLLTDEQLVKMTTVYPAKLAGLEDYIGSIKEGNYADLLIVSGDKNNPYHALTQATAKDVQLVIISGQPLYGNPDFMNQCWGKEIFMNLDNIIINGSLKTIKMPGNTSSILYSTYRNNFFVLKKKLSDAMPDGYSLAPLVEPD